MELLVSDGFNAALDLTYIRLCMSISGYTGARGLAGMRQQSHGVHEAAISIEKHFVQLESETLNSSPGAFTRRFQMFDGK